MLRAAEVTLLWQMHPHISTPLGSHMFAVGGGFPAGDSAEGGGTWIQKTSVDPLKTYLVPPSISIFKCIGCTYKYCRGIADHASYIAILPSISFNRARPYILNPHAVRKGGEHFDLGQNSLSKRCLHGRYTPEPRDKLKQRCNGQK